MSLGHLVQVDEHVRVARVEADVLVEEHRRVAVAVERDDAPVHRLGVGERGGFCREPAEERQHALVPGENHALRVPLHAEHRLVFRRLDRLDDAVGCPSADPEAGCGLTDRLVVERVDGQAVGAEEAGEQRVRLDVQGV